jgi:hypothetical protein
MLWYKLLQNTIYCGTLHLTSYRNNRGNFIDYSNYSKDCGRKMREEG